MGVKIPDLDDVKFQKIVEEAVRRIPQFKTEWTDFNLHDPGITIIELLAWLVEAQIFQLNQITEKHYEQFLQLFCAAGLSEKLEENEVYVRTDLKKPYRAVTLSDYEFLAKGVTGVGRAKALWKPGQDENQNAGTVEVIVVPTIDKNISNSRLTKTWDTTELRKKVCEELDKCRLLTTRVRVVDADYVTISVEGLVKISPNALKDEVYRRIRDALIGFFGNSGEEKTFVSAWPFGRTVYLSEVYALLEGVDGVDCVQDLTLCGIDGNYKYDVAGNVLIEKNGLVEFGIVKIAVVGAQRPCKDWGSK